jgi:hypothetical protein
VRRDVNGNFKISAISEPGGIDKMDQWGDDGGVFNSAVDPNSTRWLRSM